MNRLTKISMHRVDTVHKVDEWQDTLYTYDYRGLVKTEVNAKGAGKVFIDLNGNKRDNQIKRETGYLPISLKGYNCSTTTLHLFL